MKNDKTRLEICRRELLAGAAYFALGASRASAAVIFDHLPWTPNAGNPPAAAALGPWLFFTGDEGRMVEALADRIIPPDPDTPGGKDSGSAVFIDRQLAGPYVRQDGLYVRPPFLNGAKNQGHQSEKGPTQEYRDGLAALNKACKAQLGGKGFFDLPYQWLMSSVRSEGAEDISNFNNLPVWAKGEVHFAAYVLFKSSVASNDCRGLALVPA